MNELRIALRSLLRSPGFSLVSISTLAIAIGANTTVFSFVNALLVRSLPVDEPAALRWVSWQGDLEGITGRGWWAQDNKGQTVSSSFPYPVYELLRDQSGANADVMGVYRLGQATVRLGTSVKTVDGLMVSDNFFETIGVGIQLGQPSFELGALDGSDSPVVLSHGLWRQSFNGDANVIGQSISIEGQQFVVSGILESGFRGPIKGYDSGFYLPFSSLPQIAAWPSLTDPACWWMELLVRLKGTRDEAELTGAMQSVLIQAVDQKYLVDSAAPMQLSLNNGRAGIRHSSEPLDAPLRPLAGVALTILLVVCANLAGLMIARGADRKHSIAIEGALGASQWQLLRRPLIECALLALGGAVFGMLIGSWSTSLLADWLWDRSLAVDVSFDRSVVVFTGVLSLGTMLLFGLLPTWRYSRANPCGSLKSRSSLGAPRLKWGRAFVSVQIGLTFVLLLSSTLFLRGLHRLSEVDLGFVMPDLHTFSIDAGGGGIEETERFEFYRRIRADILRLPGISDVGMASNPLVSHRVNTSEALVRDARTGEKMKLPMLFMRVDESFLPVIGTSLLMGRGFQLTDTEANKPVMIVNRTLAKQAFGNESPIGKVLEVGGDSFTVVGVCADFKYDSLKASESVSLLSSRQFPRSDDRMVCYFRSEGNHAELPSSISELMATRYSKVPVSEVESMQSIVHQSTGPERAAAYSCALLSGLALLLCGIGLYGLMCYLVAGRKGELGLRLALGDSRRGVTLRVVWDVLRLSLVGVLGGGLVAIGSLPMLAPYIYGPATIDLRAGMLATGFIVAVCVIAAWIPAIRASRTSPMTALLGD